jgi:putative nucleotidyltransferase with HDIG domain
LGGRILVASSEAGYGYLPLQSGDFPGVIGALGVAALVGFALNAVLLGVGWYFYQGSSPVQVMREVVWMVPTQMALAAVGLTIAQVLSISYLGFALFVFPLLVARGVYRHYVELRSAFNDTIRFFVGFLEAKDPYTRGHSERVAAYAVEIGEALGLTPRQTEDLEYAALLHDMGKLRVPRYVLTKPGKLDEGEFALIRDHPVSGAEIVRRIPYLEHLATPVECHHESYDGSGYSAGLAGDAIPMLSRVLAVADSFDAMTTARPYRRAMSEEEAFAELESCAGSQFDPVIVTAWRAERVEAEASSVATRVSERPAAGGAE